MMRRRDDLPLPDGPTSATVSPRSSTMSTPRSAWTRSVDDHGSSPLPRNGSVDQSRSTRAFEVVFAARCTQAAVTMTATNATVPMASIWPTLTLRLVVGGSQRRGIERREHALAVITADTAPAVERDHGQADHLDDRGDHVRASTHAHLRGHGCCDLALRFRSARYRAIATMRGHATDQGQDAQIVERPSGRLGLRVADLIGQRHRVADAAAGRLDRRGHFGDGGL